MTNAYLLEHLNDIETMAKALCKGTDQYEDIRQEMCVACLELETDKPFKYAMKVMEYKAFDYLRGKGYSYSAKNRVPHCSWDALPSDFRGQRSIYTKMAWF